jgi:solute carrier family 35 protein F1/2
LIIGIQLFGFYVYKLYPVAFVMTILGNLPPLSHICGQNLISGLVIYYSIVKNIAGEAMKPWLGGANQPMGIVGVGTYKRKENIDEENIQPSPV